MTSEMSFAEAVPEIKPVRADDAYLVLTTASERENVGLLLNSRVDSCGTRVDVYL